MLMTLATPSLVCYKVSIVYTSILILQTCLTALVPSTTLQVIRVLPLTTQVSSTAHMSPSRWFVPSVRTPSNQRLDSRLATASSRTHSQKEQQQAVAHLPSTPTATTEESRSQTSCDSFSHIFFRGSSDPLFLSKYK